LLHQDAEFVGLVAELNSELERAHATIAQLQLDKGAGNHEAVHDNAAGSNSSDVAEDARIEALTIEVIELKQQVAYWKGAAEGLREETGQLERAAVSARTTQAAELKPAVWLEAERLRQQVAELQERQDHSLRLQREVDRLRKRSADADAHERELESSVKRIARMEAEHAEAHRLFQVERSALRDEIARLRSTVAEFESGLVHHEQSEQTLQRCVPFVM
jgi:chromosome segregation ATPase